MEFSSDLITSVHKYTASGFHFFPLCVIGIGSVDDFTGPFSLQDVQFVALFKKNPLWRKGIESVGHLILNANIQYSSDRQIDVEIL